MKISIITRHAPNNYGSLLQTIATEKIIAKLGHTAITLEKTSRD